jgi:6-phosphogluconolactonase
MVTARRLAYETLLQNAVQATAFWLLVPTSQTLEADIAALNADARKIPDVAVLGMGEDGHTASIFADSPEWDFAIFTPERFVAVYPGAAPHAGVNWSMSALKQVGRLFLLIAGPGKLDLLNAAAAAPQKDHLKAGKRQRSETRCPLA